MMKFAKMSDDAVELKLIRKEDCADWLAGLDEPMQIWAKSNGFTASAGQVLTIPDSDGSTKLAAIGIGDATARERQRFIVAKARALLPGGIYRLSSLGSLVEMEEAALGWLLAGYRFARYAKNGKDLPGLVAPDGVDANRLEVIAQSEAFTRDLINTPSNDMGPADLEAAALALASEYGAKSQVVRGEELLEQNFPMIHAVGRASTRTPRLIELNWGEKGPAITLVGKGVCFDTGGLNLKPGASMGSMKKDMGGAANVLGLAQMIMALEVPVRLRVLIPAVENSVSGNSFRPGDILTSRKGLTVEINNTDAEGRLVLADALALADEGAPDLVVSMATLTGAARVAVGPDLAPFFATSDEDARAVEVAAAAVRDPVWRMPFWSPYDAMIEPGIADLDNAPKGGFAGAITAALFLKRFVTDCPRYMHFDIFGWTPTAAPGRTQGGAGQGIRALLQALPDLAKK